MTMKLSKEAKDGFTWAISLVESMLKKNINPRRILYRAGIIGMEDTLFFFEYLREIGRTDLIKKLTGNVKG